MRGRFLDMYRRHSKRSVTKGGFQDKILMKTPSGSHFAEITGWVTKHWISFDEEGNSINTKNAHILSLIHI